MSKPTGGRATAAELQTLWKLVLVGLLGKLSKKRIAVDDLHQARRFLRDNNFTSHSLSLAALRRQLNRLDRLYLEGLKAELRRSPRSVSLLEEARVYSEALAAKLQEREAFQSATGAGNALPMDTPFKVQ